MASVAAAKKAYRAAAKAITEAVASGATELSFDDEAFRNLKTIPPELRGMTGLTRLDLDNTRVTDLSPLQGLTGLQTLSLDQTSVTDLSHLQGLTGLQRLAFNQTSVTDLSPLQGLTGLQWLSLNQTSVTDLSPLQGLTKLQTLSLDQTSVSDLSPLQGLTGLQWLSLNQTSVTDLSPLQGFTGLQWLSIEQTSVTDLSPLQGLTELHWLSFDHTSVTDLSPLQAITRLQSLRFNQTSVTDLSPLQGLTELQVVHFDRTGVTDLTPLKGITTLQSLWLTQTDIADLSALHGMKKLQTLWIDQTGITDLSPLKGMSGLQTLFLDQTRITDLSPLQGIAGLYRLSLGQTKIADLRLLITLPELGKGPLGGIFFADTSATRLDPELHRLSLIEDTTQRTQETIAYLKTLPPYPEPLPWLAAPDAPTPAPDPAVPLRQDDHGIGLATVPITADERDDPIRSTLHNALQQQTSDLIRVSGNIDEAAYQQACKLRDLLESGFAAMDPLLVHLAIEALRRIRTKTPSDADRDYLLALEAVIDTGPGLTLDTRQVQLFVDRAQRNRLERLAEAEADAQIRLAQSIANSDLTAPDLKSVAMRAADDQVYDQFTAIRPTLGRNYVILAGQTVVAGLIAGPLGEAGMQAVTWLVANAADIRTMSVLWGEPFAAWIAPILDRAQQLTNGANHLASKLRKLQ